MTISNTKKVVQVEILHLDETGYGPEGKYTRSEWRAECLCNFEKNAREFLEWQKGWKQQAANDTDVDFGVKLHYEDGTCDVEQGGKQKSHLLDFVGHEFMSHLLIAKGYRFLYDISFERASVTGDASFENAIFEANVIFEHIKFNEFTCFKNAIFKKSAHFFDADFNSGVDFYKTKFSEWVVFYGARFTGNALFENVVFESLCDFRSATFFSNCQFAKSEFKNTSKFHQTIFKGEVDFENAKFDKVGHFEGASFNAENSKIPSFRGVNVSNTLLEFSDDTYFTKKDHTENAIKNIAFLKHLSEKNGQIDQALNFNAMELRAKYRQKLSDYDSGCGQVFMRFFNKDWWIYRPTWFYEQVSNFGRSFWWPLIWYIVSCFLTFILALGIAFCHSPQDCQGKQWRMFSDLQRYVEDCELYNKDANVHVNLSIDGYRAALEYTGQRATGLIDFTSNSKVKDAVTQRLFGELIEPVWMRILGVFISIINTALLFLIALGLRNNYRLK